MPPPALYKKVGETDCRNHAAEI